MPVTHRVGGALTALLAAAVLLSAAGCAPAAPSDAGAATPPAIAERLDDLDAAVAGWSSAGDLATAQVHAEAARNLIVGPDGHGYGDADGDGSVEGAVDRGLLPGLTGEPGLAQPPTNSCVERDVLGGAWTDPAARWAEVTAVLDAWAPDRNTMPQLASHPQRVVGWATLTVDADSVAQAHEYAGHAQLHVDITRAAYTTCVS